MASPAGDVSWVLNLRSVGSTASTPSVAAWAIKVGRLVDAPDKLIALYDTGGFTPNTKWLLDFPTVQAIIRSAKEDYAGGYAKAQEVKDALLGYDPGNVNVGPDLNYWSGVTMLSDITFLKFDDKNRALFSVNFRILQERTKSALSNRESLDYTGP